MKEHEWMNGKIGGDQRTSRRVKLRDDPDVGLVLFGWVIGMAMGIGIGGIGVQLYLFGWPF